jgi:hypothetical protein
MNLEDALVEGILATLGERYGHVSEEGLCAADSHGHFREASRTGPCDVARGGKSGVTECGHGRRRRLSETASPATEELHQAHVHAGPQDQEEARRQRLEARYNKERQLRALEVAREQAFLQMCEDQRREVRERNRADWIRHHHEMAASHYATARELAERHMQAAQRLEQGGV